MRVALLTYSTKPRGGVVHTVELAEALARAGAEVTLWSLSRGGDTEFYRPVDPAVSVSLVPFEARDGEEVGPRILRSIETLREAFDARGADVVHAQDCISANAVAGAVGAGAVGRCIRTIHHLEQFTTPELAACHERAIVEPFARICVSRAVAQEVRDGWGLNPTVIANGVDAARFAAAADDVESISQWRRRFGPYILAVGGIEPRKGSLDLLEAHALLTRRHREVGLVFAGGETLFDYRDYRARFDARAAELGAPTILGPVEHDRLPSLVAGASALAFLSTKEGFGLAAMEALAAGIPVVARDLPVLREVFGDSVTYADGLESACAALESALIEPNHRRASGRELAFSHSWDTAAAAHLEFYGRVAI